MSRNKIIRFNNSKSQNKIFNYSKQSSLECLSKEISAEENKKYSGYTSKNEAETRRSIPEDQKYEYYP